MTSEALLVDLLNRSANDLKAGTPANEFRFEHADEIQTIENLETAGFILNVGDNYRLTVKSILTIANKKKDAQKVRDGIIEVIDELRHHYSKNRTERAVSIVEIARNLAGSKKEYQFYADCLQQIVPVGGDVYNAKPTIYACASLLLDLFGKPVADGNALLDLWLPHVLNALPLPEDGLPDTVTTTPRSRGQHRQRSRRRAANFGAVLYCIKFMPERCIADGQLVAAAALASTAVSQPKVPVLEGEKPLVVSTFTPMLQEAIKGRIPLNAATCIPQELVRRTLLHVVSRNPLALTDRNSVPEIAKEAHMKLDWPVGFRERWSRSQINADLQNIVDLDPPYPR